MTEGLTNQRPQKSNLQQPNHDSDHGCLLTLSQVPDPEVNFYGWMGRGLSQKREGRLIEWLVS